MTAFVLAIVLAGPAMSAARMPVVFEPAAERFGADVRLYARTASADVFFTPRGPLFSLREAAPVRPGFALRFAGARDVAPSGARRLPGTLNCYLGNDRKRWVTGAPLYGAVRYRGLHPGVDVVFHADAGALQLEVELAPGASLAQLALRFDGASSLSVNARGALELSVAGRLVRFDAPVAFQGGRTLAARWVVRGGEARLEVPGADPLLAMRVDPRFTYLTYFGGDGDDNWLRLAVTRSGATWIAFASQSTSFQNTPMPLTPFAGGRDLLLALLSPDAGSISVLTYLGGLQTEFVDDVALDSSEGVVFSGRTTSPDFPDSFDAGIGGTMDAYVARLSSTGALQFARLLGGSLDGENALGVAVDVNDVIWVVGETDSLNFPTRQAFQGSRSGPQDAFVARLALDGALLTSSYLGGAGAETAYDVAIAPWGAVIVGTADRDGLIARVASDGGLLSVTSWGGSGTDVVLAAALSDAGELVIAGHSDSGSLPGDGGIAGGQYAFAAQLSGATLATRWSYSFGGGAETPAACAWDVFGNIIVGGSTTSPGFPQVGTMYGPQGGQDAFLAAVARGGRGLAWSALFGGNSKDVLSTLAAPRAGLVSFGGWTNSNDLMLVNPFQPQRRDGGEVMLGQLLIPAPILNTLGPMSGPCDGGLLLRVYVAEDLQPSVRFGPSGPLLSADAGAGYFTVGMPPLAPGRVPVTVVNADSQESNAVDFTCEGAGGGAAGGSAGGGSAGGGNAGGGNAGGGTAGGVSPEPLMAVVQPRAPEIDAGDPQALDGTGSTGPRPLTYLWKLALGPQPVDFTDAGIQTFVTNAGGVYLVELKVRAADGGVSQPAYSVVTVRPLPSRPTAKLGCSCDQGSGLLALAALLIARLRRRG